MKCIRYSTFAALVAVLMANGAIGRAEHKLNEACKSGVAGTLTATEPEQVLKFINNERKKHDLAGLGLDSKMDEQARQWADHLHALGKLRHGGFKGDRGQCIAEGQPSAASVVKAWMSDAGHRAILLGKSYRKLGLGRSGKFWVADFK